MEIHYKPDEFHTITVTALRSSVSFNSNHFFPPHNALYASTPDCLTVLLSVTLVDSMEWLHAWQPCHSSHIRSIGLAVVFITLIGL